MKRLIAASWMVICLFGTVAAQDKEECRRTLSVQGTAEMDVNPDMVEIHIGVDTRSADARKAMSLNGVALKRLIEIAKKSGVSADDIQNDHVGLQSRQEKKGSENVIVYAASQRLVITLRDLLKYDELLGALVEAGANRIDSVGFSSSKIREHRVETRTLAVRAAQSKAEALARDSGVKLKRISSISEGSLDMGNYFYRGIANTVTRAGTSDESSVPGKIKLMATVSITFEIE